MSWSICALLAAIRAKTLLKIYYPLGPVIEKDIMFAGVLTYLIAFWIYAISLIPGPTRDNDGAEYEEQLIVEEEDATGKFSVVDFCTLKESLWKSNFFIIIC